MADRRTRDQLDARIVAILRDHANAVDPAPALHHIQDRISRSTTC
ncbi:hypothetical protein [Microbispora sp. GKU 823]|nr:hypothetical protein [Microbispora sp. GKU 823]